MRIPDYAMSPLTWLMLLTLLQVFMWRRMSRAWRVAGATLTGLLLFVMAPAGANLLVWAVQAQAPSAAACPAPLPDTIVVLSGGTDRVPRAANDYSALSATSLDRLFAGVALWRRTPDARLVIAGGGRRVPEAVLLANLAVQMGVPPAAVQIEQHSHTTWENAMNVAAMSPQVPRRIWLVTSALHMPRALGAFRAWGFTPCAWPGESLYQPFYPALGYFVPQQSSLRKTELAIHELIGGLVYRGLAWKHSRSISKQRSSASSPAAAAEGP